ncbi:MULTISPECIES: PAP/fibrillin family protein [unclassified Roseofilum]|uniref:PAP/fibrillin family protein n=1 Tax=unclassified Roseofilum TaxID=2620099 RepID=UPI001B0104E0|nr:MULTISPECIES: PAP/fibrillin family protein [unclassified Roseofilum]MBP0008386.1 PAP/fibrillin family protein [Roseofilum sp. Belize Diploria]MBP0013429.1 PAP/fibrillin family protein [Roseofilum sp. SID3]MBP0035597.1 PAP/fibrillin family protein [Roseofilum sp. Belize BBD 4]MBP0036704.1 PAP/fibrillin family protein [Roseofilum sp. SID1]MBP0042021.1 PAP/fibrillin family protein [Roseofilum sp. SBFL]
MIGKDRLLEAIAGTNRGILASATEKQAILSYVVQLEERNPNPCPTEFPELLSGDWRLLYTTSAELLNIDRIPLYQLGQIYQCIRVDEQAVYNIGELDGLPYLDSLVSVRANFSVVNERRVNVRFNRGIFGLQRVLGYESPSQMIEKIQESATFWPFDFPISEENQKGWLDITYLDRDLRINRGNKESVFVLARC